MLRTIAASSKSHIDAARRTLDAYTTFAASQGFAAAPFDDGLLVARFLEDEDVAARSRAAARNDDTTGETVRYSRRGGLVYLAGLGCAFPMHVLSLSPHLQGVPLAVEATPIPSFSVRMVASLERLAASSSASCFVRGVAAAFVAQTLSCSRFAQLQYSVVTTSPAAGVRRATALRDKTHASRPATRAFFVPESGLLGPGYLDALDAMLADIDAPTFFLRDTDAPSGDPTHATRWIDAPCLGQRANKALRSVLVLATGMPLVDACRYELRSCRHFLPIVARLRGESAATRNELGRWAGSTGHDFAAPRAALHANARAARLPDLYSRAEQLAIVTAIIVRQIRACANLLRTRSSSHLPMHGFDGILWE